MLCITRNRPRSAMRVRGLDLAQDVDRQYIMFHPCGVAAVGGGPTVLGVRASAERVGSTGRTCGGGALRNTS